MRRLRQVHVTLVVTVALLIAVGVIFPAVAQAQDPQVITPVPTATQPVPTAVPTEAPTAVPTAVPTQVPPKPPAEPVPIPEPITVILFGTGLAGLSAAAAARRKKNEEQ